MIANTIFFIIFSVVAVISALLMITRKHPLSSALSLIITFIALAGLFSLLSAKLVFIMQILVYAGAIMTLIIFSIMLININKENLPKEEKLLNRIFISSIFLIPIMVIIFKAISLLPYEKFSPVSKDYGTVKSVGFYFFQNYSFPFEVLSILLLVSLIGVVIIAKRKIN